MTEQIQTTPEHSKKNDVQDETRQMLLELKILKRFAVVGVLFMAVVPAVIVVVAFIADYDLSKLCRIALIIGVFVSLFSLAGILILRKDLNMKTKSKDWKNLILVSLIILMLVAFFFNRFSIVGIILLFLSTYKYFKVRKTEMQKLIEKTENQ